jgi:site-specific DNA-cytosine methylase
MPDGFLWPESSKKTHRYRIIGNGWASLMAKRMSEAFRAADPESRTVIDLFCGGGCGAVGWHGRAWESRSC